MIFSARKRLLALMVACLMLGSSVSACAETALVMKDAAVYASAKTSSKKLGTLDAGTKLELVAEKSGWAKVELNGNVGYMKASAVAEYKTYSGKTAYAADDTAMYKSFSTSSKKLGTIPEGAKVSVSATAGDWARVSYKDHTGFVDLDDLTTKAPEAEKEPEFKSYTAYAKADDTKVYNSKGKKTGTVDVNTKVTVIAENGDVCQVKRGDSIAYMYKSDLSTEKVEVEPEFKSYIAYAKADDTKVYNSKGKKTGTVDVNTKVTVIAEKGDVCQVKRGDSIAYMYKSDLSTEKVEVEPEFKSYTAYAKADGTKVYNSKGKKTGTVDINTKVTVIAENGTVCQVKRGDSIAYMYKSDLSTEKIEEDNGITEISPTTYYVKNDNAKVYDADGDVIAKLSVNTAVTVTAYNDEYAKVTSGSKAGLMHRSDLSTKKADDGLVLEYGDKGEAVTKVQARLKELGYFTGTVGGNYLDLTKAAVAAFQAAAGLTTTGVCDEKTLTAMFDDDAPKKEAEKAPEKNEDSNDSGYSTAKAAHGTAKAMDWWTSGIQSIFSRGTVATVTDVSTGIAWYTKRSGGTNHADVQPLTAADTNSMKKAVGSWSWNRRAIFVTINGVNYAASMNCMPHGSGNITDNNFNGHHCIHFTNSRTHGSNSVCSLHQAAIKKAANATL